MQKLKKKIILFILLVSSFYLTGIFALPIVHAAPAAPSNLTATTQSSTSIQLQWRDNSSDETRFDIEKDAGFGFNYLTSVPSDSTTYLDASLAADHSYSFRVRALGDAGFSPYSNIATTTTSTAVPNAPTNLTASPISPTQIDLQWTDNAVTETGFKIERATVSTGPWNQIGTTGVVIGTGSTVAYSNTGLTPATTYYYRVVAYNAGGNSAYSNTVNATTLAPPPNPSMLGFFSDIGDLSSSDIIISAGRSIAYVATGYLGLVAVDISTPTQPKLYGPHSSQHPNGSGSFVAASGNTALTKSSRGTDIVDISDPSYLRVVSSITGNPSGAAISGNYAYIADGDLKVVDISTPALARVIKTITTPGEVLGAAVLGNALVITDFASGVRVYDISIPANPFEKSSIPPSIFGINSTVTEVGITTINNIKYAVVADIQTKTINIININNLSAPQKVGSYNDPNSVNSITDMLIDGNNVCLTGSDGSTGLVVIDISTPSIPRKIGQYNATFNSAYSVAISGQKAYIGAALGDIQGFKVIDVANPASMNEVGTPLQSKTSGNQLAVSGNKAVVTGSSRGTDIIDVSDSSRPQIKASISGTSVDAVISGNYAYLASAGDLKVVDISIPASANVVKTVDLGLAYGVAVSGDLLVVNDAFNGLKTYNIAGSFAANPQYQGMVSLGGIASKVTIATIDDIKYAFVLNSGPAKLQIINVQAPVAPVKIREIGFSDVLNIFVSGNYAYLGNNDGLFIIDIRAPASASVVGSYTPSDAGGIFSSFVYNNMAFMTFFDRNRVIDISIPASPNKIGNDFYSVGYGANDIVIANNKIYLADSKAELVIMDIYHDNLSLTKSASVSSVQSGDEITYTLFLENTTSSTMTNLTVTDPIPTGTTFVSADNGGRVVSGKVTWDPTSTPALATFVPATNLTLTFRVRVN